MNDKIPNPNVKLFIDRLRRLDSGGKARLKRRAGQPLAESRDALGLFYSLLSPGVPEFQHEAYFLIATLFPIADEGGAGDFGAALHRVRQVKNSNGLDRRLEILLDADESQFPYRLRQAVRYVKSCDGRVNWERLLEDALRWTHPERFVQKRWAQSYFADQAIDKNSQPTKSNKGD